MRKPGISVIIPTYEEANIIGQAVTPAHLIGDEVIVSDASKEAATADEARKAGAKVIKSKKGRGLQLNKGAKEASCEILLFLHADVKLSKSARGEILKNLENKKIAGGNFFITFFPKTWFSIMIEKFYHNRRIITNRYYGDSAIFVRKDVYKELGGFPRWPIMEDYAFSKKMEENYKTCYINSIKVRASSRRFQKHRLITGLRWVAVQLFYWVGVNPDKLSKLYPDRRT